jgi:hypothetical protein
LPSPDPSLALNAPVRPLFAKELRDILGGRALWTLLLLECPLVGYSFFQAMSLYGEASAAALQSPVLATSLSPLDGVLVPTFGSFYVAMTLLFPFVAIRALGAEKESGALRLLVQLPYRPSMLVAIRLVAADLRRNVLAKLERAMPLVSIRLGEERGALFHPPATTLTAKSNIAMADAPTSAAPPARARFCHCCMASPACGPPRQSQRRIIRDTRTWPTASSHSSGFWSRCPC